MFFRRDLNDSSRMCCALDRRDFQAVLIGLAWQRVRFALVFGRGSTGMEVAISSARASGKFPARDELTAQQMIEIYRLMFLSRAVDDREILLKRQQKIFFQISSAGHEALQVGAALALRSGYDWFFPYYRDGALALALGVTPYDMMLQAVGAASDPASGGRQMPTALEQPCASHRQHFVLDGDAATPGRRLRRSWTGVQPASRDGRQSRR